MKKIISIIIPALNEEQNLPELINQLQSIEKNLSQYNFEFILIDNKSTDKTGPLWEAQCEKYPHYKYLCFSRKFSYEVSLSLGIHVASGDAIIFFSSDLQEPIELVPKMLQTWEQQKCDVVYGVLNKRSDSSWLKSLLAKLAYKIIAALTPQNFIPDSTDFRLISKRIAFHFKEYKETQRSVKSIIHSIGFEQIPFYYDRKPRLHGQSGSNYLYLFELFKSILKSNSHQPLKWSFAFGLFLLIFNLALVILSAFNINFYLSSWVWPVFFIVFSLLFIFIGIQGEYLINLIQDTQKRPLWIIEKQKGFNDDQLIGYYKT